MANILGKVNIPTKVISYTGLETSTADVIVDNDNKTIAVNVNAEEITKNNVTEEELSEALANKVSSLSVSNITTLTDAQLDSLKVGDVVQKITGNMKHCYIVTYKEEHHGICLSYFACGYLETISYDYTQGHWVFNSKDVCECVDVFELPSKPTQAQCLEALNHTILKYGEAYFYKSDINTYFNVSVSDDGLNNGSVTSLIIDAEGSLTVEIYEIGAMAINPSQITGGIGTKLYKHDIFVTGEDQDEHAIDVHLIIITTDSLPYTINRPFSTNNDTLVSIIDALDSDNGYEIIKVKNFMWDNHGNVHFSGIFYYDENIGFEEIQVNEDPQLEVADSVTAL